MLYWALVFFIISLVAGLFGMYEIAGVTMDVAQFLFWGFLIIAGIFLAAAIWTGRKVSNLVHR